MMELMEAAGRPRERLKPAIGRLIRRGVMEELPRARRSDPRRFRALVNITREG